MKLRVQENGGKNQHKNELLIDINNKSEEIHRDLDGIDYQFFVLKSNPDSLLKSIQQKNEKQSTEPYSQTNLLLDEKTSCHFLRYRRIPTTMVLADSIKVTDLKNNEMYAFIADQQT